MNDLVAWGEATLVASTALLLLVLLLRAPARRWVGPRLAYALWALPAARLILPPLPATLVESLPLAGATARMSVLFAGPRTGIEALSGPAPIAIGTVLLAVWLAGALGLFTFHAVRHGGMCRRLRVRGTVLGRLDDVSLIATDVEGPLAFGVLHRFIAVPRGFASAYTAHERELALAHERAHHARGDLLANWVSLAVLAAHWWNPVAWAAIRAFRDDQEFATDAHVLAARSPGARAVYAHVLATASGIGALPACNLHARSNLKGRLMMIAQKPRSRRQLVLGGAVLALLGTSALAATVATAGSPARAGRSQAVTIGVKPDGSGSYALLIGGKAVAPGAPLPGGRTLPADFTGPGGCDLKPGAKPSAMVIKGEGTTRTYTVMCASAAPAPVRDTLAEGLASLKTMRVSVATQPATAFLTDAERAHALGAIDRSIVEVEATLARAS